MSFAISSTGKGTMGAVVRQANNDDKRDSQSLTEPKDLLLAVGLTGMDEFSD